MAHDILLYTIGNREVYIDGAVPNRGRFRSQCRQMLEAVQAHREQLQRVAVPRLRACLDYISMQGVEELRAIYLVVTEGNPDARFVESDTREAGELAKLWLTETVRPALPRFLGKTGVRLILLSGVEPNEYGRVYHRLGESFARLPDAQEIARAWLFPQPGTPAMSASVILHALARWRDRVRMLVVPEGFESAEESPFPRAFLGDMRREVLLARLEAYDLAGALALAPEEGPLREVLASALARSRFDFPAAHRHLDRALAAMIHSAASVNRAVRDLRDALASLPSRPDPAQSRGHLAELVWNARLCWRAGRYVDFLGRMYRLEEGLLRHWLERLGFATDDSPERRQESRRRFWERVDALGLAEQVSREYGVERGGALNRPAFAAVLSAVLEAGMAGELEAELRELLPAVRGPVREIAELRNRSILGHGFERVDPDEIRSKVRQSLDTLGADADPVEALLEQLLRVLAPGGRDPYEATVTLARSLLQEP